MGQVKGRFYNVCHLENQLWKSFDDSLTYRRTMVVPWCGIGGSPERCRSVNDVYGRTQKEDWLAKKKNKKKK